MTKAEERYEAAADAYRQDPSEKNRKAYHSARDAVQAERASERDGRPGLTATPKES